MARWLEISKFEELLPGAGCLVRRRGSARTVSCLQIFEGLSCGRGKLVLWVDDGCRLQMWLSGGSYLQAVQMECLAMSGDCTGLGCLKRLASRDACM